MGELVFEKFGVEAEREAGVYTEPGAIENVLDGMLKVEFGERPDVTIVDQKGVRHGGMKVHSGVDKKRVGRGRRNQDLRENPQLGMVYRFAASGVEHGTQMLFGVNLIPGDAVRRTRRLKVIGQLEVEEMRKGGDGV